MDALALTLSKGLESMGIAATALQTDRLLQFIDLLLKWNRVYNLTSIVRPADMVSLHLLDSLAILPYLNGARVLDVGTGAGLPGLPLALFCPGKAFTLLDGNAKKTRFVRQAAIELGLSNVTVVHDRVEQFRPAQGFDCIMARAFANLPEIMAQTLHLLNPGGVLLAQKGKLPEGELNALENTVFQVIPLSIPGVDAERHLIAIKVES